MKNKLVLTFLIGILSLNIFGCGNGEITSVKEIEEVQETAVDELVNKDGVTESTLLTELKVDKAINEVVFNIITEAYENASNAKHGAAELSFMNKDYTITAQASLIQDQRTKNTLFYYTEQTDTMFNGYLYRYVYNGPDTVTDVWVVTNYGWLETRAIPPYNVDPLEIFASEDYRYSKVYERPVSFLGEDESKEETKYYTIVSAGTSDKEGLENIVRYNTTYISKEYLLPVASIIEYVDITSDVTVNADTGETIEDVQRTEVILFTFDDTDVSAEVTMDPSIDDIIDEETYLKMKAQEANSNEQESN